MKKSILAAIAYALVSTVIFSILFYNILGGAGIGIGIALGTPFFITGTMMFKSLDKDDK